MVEDTKNIYTAIGKAAGLNVIFDPKYNSTRIPVDLTNVSLFDALRIVGTLSRTFWKPVTPNTIYVTEDNPSNRNDQGEQAVQTFYLTNVSQQNDANEILIALRNLLEPRAKLYLMASQNAIVMRASPDELILAEKIINDLDRTKPEVVVDVAVLEVSRQQGAQPRHHAADERRHYAGSDRRTATLLRTRTAPRRRPAGRRRRTTRPR